jgi:release factor glutamine methyltransferase
VTAFDPLTLEQALREGAARLVQSETPRLDARVLLKAATGYDDAKLIAQSHEVLGQDIRDGFFDLIARRQKGEPVAYITGVQEFWSLEFQVTPDVLIPRGDSECLIEAVLSRRSKDSAWSILDLGVGSGCLLCALLHEMPNSTGVGVDKSEKALRMARANAASLGFDCRTAYIVSDWAGAVEGPFDIIIMNPPYIPAGRRESLPVDVSGYEPADALFAGSDGFDDYRAILADAPRILAISGLFVLEVGDGEQARRLAEMLTDFFPGASPEIVNDLEGRARGVLIDRKSFAEKD